MSKRLKQVIVVTLVFLLNLATFLYLLTDVNSTSKLLQGAIFAAVFGMLSVFFGYFVRRWWLVFLGAAGVLLVGIRAIFLIGGINEQWLHDFLIFLGPVTLMEIFAFTGSRSRPEKRVKSAR